MKKSIALLTALMLCAVMLMGCGKEEDVGGKTTPLNEPTATEAAKSEPVATTEPTAEPTEEPEEHELSLGRMDGGTYENSYAGFGCKLDADWTFYGAEELQELPEAVQGIEGSELGEAMKDYQTITDMMAENAELLGTMNVQYVKIGVKERLVYALLSEDDVIDTMLEEQKDMLIEAYAQAGITVKTMEKVEVSYLGETHKALYTAAEVSGVEYYTTQIFDYTRGQYGITLTAASYVEDRTQDILDLFYKVE